MTDRELASEPSVFGAIWRNRRLVVATSALGLLLALGLLVARSRNPSYVATSTLEVVDASRASLLEGSASITSDRFVSNQLLILRSSGVASRAAEIAVDGSGNPLFSPQEVLSSVVPVAIPGTDIIAIDFVADDEQRAIAGANAVAAAYLAIKAASIEDAAASSVARIDAALASVATETANIQEQIGIQIPNLTVVGDRISTLVDQLIAVQATLDNASDANTEAAAERLSILTSEIQSLRLVQDVYRGDPRLTALLQQQDSLVEWALQLTTRRLELEIDQQQASSGVGTLSPAAAASARTPNAGRLLGLGLFVGAISGAAAAYFLASSRRLITDSLTPEAILEAPFLGEVPDFDAEALESELPVRDMPRSASAESFRFVATSLDSKTEEIRGELVAVVSAEAGDGKSIIVANTALSAASGGKRVLIIDADFGNQSVGQNFGLSLPAPGLTDVVGGRADLLDAALGINSPDGAPISYLGRGTIPVTAPDFFRRSECQRFFKDLRGRYDLVLVDTPPMLQVAYSATVARMCDASIAVVRHEASEAQLVDLSQRLKLLGVPTLGYVYNRAPLREFMTRSDGSMKDVIGDMGFVFDVERRPSRR